MPVYEFTCQSCHTNFAIVRPIAEPGCHRAGRSRACPIHQPLELVEATIVRIEQINPWLNAVVTPMYDEAREVAAQPVSGPFGGVPFLLKDLFASYAGARLTGGSRFLNDFVAMSVPLFWNDASVPIGAHFISRFGDEATLFGLAAQLEAARPWTNRRPPIGP